MALPASTPGAVDTGDVVGFPIEEITVGGEQWLVAVADHPDARRQGLKGVTDLGDLNGMLFRFEQPTVVTFGMQGTLMGLDIAFFDADGVLIEIQIMETCQDNCPGYQSAAPVGYALEAPLGSLGALPAEARLGFSRNSELG